MLCLFCAVHVLLELSCAVLQNTTTILYYQNISSSIDGYSKVGLLDLEKKEIICDLKIKIKIVIKKVKYP